MQESEILMVAKLPENLSATLDETQKSLWQTLCVKNYDENRKWILSNLVDLAWYDTSSNSVVNAVGSPRLIVRFWEQNDCKKTSQHLQRGAQTDLACSTIANWRYSKILSLYIRKQWYLWSVTSLYLYFALKTAGNDTWSKLLATFESSDLIIVCIYKCFTLPHVRFCWKKNLERLKHIFSFRLLQRILQNYCTPVDGYKNHNSFNFL
jgi:hypothetical protein